MVLSQHCCLQHLESPKVAFLGAEGEEVTHKLKGEQNFTSESSSGLESILFFPVAQLGPMAAGAELQQCHQAQPAPMVPQWAAWEMLCPQGHPKGCLHLLPRLNTSCAEDRKSGASGNGDSPPQVEGSKCTVHKASWSLSTANKSG